MRSNRTSLRRFLKDGGVSEERANSVMTALEPLFGFADAGEVMLVADSELDFAACESAWRPFLPPTVEIVGAACLSVSGAHRLEPPAARTAGRGCRKDLNPTALVYKHCDGLFSIEHYAATDREISNALMIPLTCAKLAGNAFESEWPMVWSTLSAAVFFFVGLERFGRSEAADVVRPIIEASCRAPCVGFRPFGTQPYKVVLELLTR